MSAILDATEKPTILVVDDTPDNLALLSGLLKEKYRVKIANGGEKALTIARSDPPPDLILLDVMMPEMDGYEVCRRLKAETRTRNIPVIFLTAKVEVEDETRGLAIGAVDYITKPINPPVLMARVSAQLVVKHTLDLAEEKLAIMMENSLKMGEAADRQKLLKQILLDGKRICRCDAATLYIKTDQQTLRFAARSRDDELPVHEIPLYDAITGAPNENFVATFVAIHGTPVAIDDVYRESRFDLSGTRMFDKESHYRTVSMLTVPLSPRAGEVIGVLQFINALDPESGEIIPFSREIVSFVMAMAAQSAVLLDNINLLDAQKALMDSMIKIIAGAIDAKSAYTGGHCERVPELAMMLAQEACKVGEGPLADFAFKTPDEWNEFRIGAWLHDCGKVTTPEFVVDKATKLETIYNRIHEIRTRFEVLLRDAELACLREQLDGEDKAAAEARFTARKQVLEDDFAFLAECNLGGESMSEDRLERLRRIAGEEWLRHFDNRLGLSEGELRRFDALPEQALPVTEHLLEDQPWHVIPRPVRDVPSPKYGFRMEMPQDLYNLGEVYNLSIRRGTLTAEERYKINDHIVQTIIMLERLPFPKHMQRVPEYAGTHHETLTGTGYPRKLNAEQLSVPSRIMAIADIFEALTASDRPYKKAKTLSEAVDLLAKFKRERHIDPDLFDLFLTSGVYLRYAMRYLRPDQIDEVDFARYLGQCA